jgi:hypothetical protein
MARWIVTGLAALVLVGTTVASAEPPSTPSGPPMTPATSSPSAYDSLSPGNRRIATALFDAQKTSTTGTPTRTLDQIARERRSGKRWGDVFQSMKSQGLIQAETLGQVLGRYDRARHSRS